MKDPLIDDIRRKAAGYRRLAASLREFLAAGVKEKWMREGYDHKNKKPTGDRLHTQGLSVYDGRRIQLEIERLELLADLTLEEFNISTNHETRRSNPYSH